MTGLDSPPQDFNKAYTQTKDCFPLWIRRVLPYWLRQLIVRAYWHWYDTRDWIAEIVGQLPLHSLRLLIYRHVLGVHIGKCTNLHRRCRFYHPHGVRIGNNTVINRDILLDGRMGITIGNNVSISEGVVILTLEHDPQDASFGVRGNPVFIGDRVFVGTRAIILPGVTVGEGAVVAAGAVVAHNVPPYTIVGGVPAQPIGDRQRDLDYTLNYRKFLG